MNSSPSDYLSIIVCSCNTISCPEVASSSGMVIGGSTLFINTSLNRQRAVLFSGQPSYCMATNDLRNRGVDREGCVGRGRRSKEIQRSVFLIIFLLIIIKNFFTKCGILNHVTTNTYKKVHV